MSAQGMNQYLLSIILFVTWLKFHDFVYQLILHLKQDCNDLSEEELSKLGVNLLNCQSYLEGRPVYPCSSSMVLKA